MPQDQRNLLPIKTIPITDASVAMLVWELFELRENYKELLEFVTDLQEESSLKAQQASFVFALWTSHVVEQAAGYQRSIETILAKRGLPCPTGLDELEALALMCRAGDKLVCQVAMFKCYVALNAALASNEVDKFRMVYIEKTFRTVEVLVGQRTRQEQEFANAALQPFKAAGFRFDDSVCSSNPYGLGSAGPEWEIGSAMSSVTPALH